MDEYSTKSLQYGHFGKAVYHSQTQTWAFLRTLAAPPRISYSGVTRTTIQSPYTSVECPSTPKRSTLSQGYPELIAGYRLAHSEKLSRNITAASEACNPLISILLDFGHAVDSDIDTSGRRAVPIVAFASGECGNTISFRTMVDDPVELEQHTAAQLRVPAIGNEVGIEWSADGAPIRQICFSHALHEGATFMAARFSSTVIFRPLYRRTPVPVSVHRGNDPTAHDYQISRLDPNYLLEISTLHTGDIAHADVKFNPWNQNQLAIVDENGNWGIWELHHQHKRNKDNWVAACVTSDTLPCVGVGDGQNAGARSRHDGWLAIEWAGNENHIIVCDRRCCMLYQTNGNRVHPHSIELGFKNKSEWILGIKRSTWNSSHIFILTTSRLIWFDISPALIPIHENTSHSLSPRLSWRHFRDSDDTTLQLTSLAVDKDFYIILFSRLNHFVLAFHCSEPSEVVGDLVPIPDPFILHVPSTSDNEDNVEVISIDTHFSTLVFREVAPTATSEQYIDLSLSFLKAFALDSSLRVHESLYLKPSTSDSEGERLCGRNVLRARHLRLTGLQKKALNSRSDFIVDDWDEFAHGNVSILDRGIDSIAPLAEPQFTLDYTQVYALATGVLGLLLQDDEETTERSFQESVHELLNKVTDQASSTSGTALEILRRSRISLVLDDIDQNAQELCAFVSEFASSHSAFGDRDHLLVQPYNSFCSRSNQQVNLLDAAKLDLVAIYDRLVNHWLIDLPSDLPGRARITKEKAIRHVVADIVLSKVISVHKSTTVDSSVNNENIPPYSITSLINSPGPVDEQFSHESLARSVGQDFQSQANNTATQSSFALGDLVFAERQANEWPTFTVLSSYTAFSRTGPISRDAERILDHWKPGVDPALYSLPVEGSQLAANNKASGRNSRKKMSQAMKHMSLDSSIPPPVSCTVPADKRDWGSQPDNSQPLMIRLQSSQATEDLPMTQVERGAFGGRETTRKSGMRARKKKRAAGF
ncbi:RNA polymerase I-specific transcription initiation factor RRN6-like protein [Aspergillus varians]